MTPLKNDKDVQKLLKLLNATHTEIYLDVEPEAGARPNDCFINVQNKVAVAGGQMIMGWQIWKNKYLVEAECHVSGKILKKICMT